MPNQQLLEYIRLERGAGATKDAIVAALAASGWQTKDIEQGWAVAIEAELPAPAIQPTVITAQPVATVVPKEAAQPKKTSAMLRIITGILIAVIVVGAWGAAFWYRKNMQISTLSEPSQTLPATTIPSAPVVSTATYSFTPTASNIPGFTLTYPLALGTPQTKEEASSVGVAFGTSSSAFTLDFSLFSNPLSASQTPQDYLQSTYPNAMLTDLSTNSHTIIKVASSDFAQNQSVYYIFLKSANTMTVEATGNPDTFSTSTEDGLVTSLQFTNTTY